MAAASSDEILPEEVRKQIQRFRVALDKLETIIDGEAGVPFSQVNKELTPVQRATHYLSVARTIYHAYLLLLRTQGTSTGKGCPLNAEKDRLSAYSKKVRKLESAEYLATHRPATEINIAAANRFINHAISDLSAEQRAALKQAGTKRKTATFAAASEAPEAVLEVSGSPADMARAFLQRTLGPTSKKAK